MPGIAAADNTEYALSGRSLAHGSAGPSARPVRDRLVLDPDTGRPPDFAAIRP
jgi:hypothetical protein